MQASVAHKSGTIITAAMALLIANTWWTPPSACASASASQTAPSQRQRQPERGELRDYCWPDVFNASCSDNEVILMTSARYGRMNKPNSHCAMTAASSGCFADVLTQVDARCSGRSSCLIEFPDEELHSMQPCPKDMLLILEASYICIPVTYPERYPCYPVGAPQILSATEGGYLTGMAAPAYQANTALAVSANEPSRCVYKIQAQKGQKVNLTLYDFSSKNSQMEENNVCIMYLTITDPAGGADTTACRGNSRVRSLVESEGRSVKLEIITYTTQRPDGMFLIRYDAIGCPDPLVAKDATYKRHLDRVTVTCNHSAETWFLYCNGSDWIGPRRNCTKGTMPLAKPTDNDGADGTFPFGLATAVIIGIILGILIGLALLAVILVLNRRKQHRQRYIADGSTQPQPFGGSASGGSFTTTRLPPDGMTKSYKLDQYGYAHVWELHHLHDCPDESGAPLTSTTVPVGGGAPHVDALQHHHNMGGGTFKPLKYNASSASGGGGGGAPGDNGMIGDGYPGGGGAGVDGGGTLKLSQGCPHQTGGLCSHHMGMGEQVAVYRDNDDLPPTECQPLDLGVGVLHDTVAPSSGIAAIHRADHDGVAIAT